MALNPYELKALNDDEQAKADAAEKLIDEQIEAEYNANLDKTSFVVNSSDLSKAIGGLSQKVRKAVLDAYRSEKWKIEDKGGKVTLSMPKRRGRRKKSEMPEPQVVAEAKPTEDQEPQKVQVVKEVEAA